MDPLAALLFLVNKDSRGCERVCDEEEEVKSCLNES